MSAVKGLFGSFESELYPKHEEKHDSQTQLLSPIVNMPAGYPVVAPKASTPLPSPKRAKLSSFVETVPDSEADVEGNATLSTTISGSGQTSLLSISFQKIPQNPSGLPNYDCDPKKSQTGIIPASPKATATLAELDHYHESAKVAIALNHMYINLIKELHALLMCGAISRTEYQAQLDIILGQMAAL